MKEAAKLILVIFLISFIACSEAENNSPEAQDPYPESTGAFEDLKDAVQDFSFSHFQEVLKEEEDNVLVSPLSLEIALYMTMNGANGNTLEEFRTALSLDKFYPDRLNEQYEVLVEKLVPSNNDTELGIHNTIFHDQAKVDLADDFKTRIETSYNGEITDADFSDPATLDLINSWAEEKTEGRIEEILDDISEEEVIFLINALYFKSDWEKGFLLEWTRELPFTTANGQTINVDFMSSDSDRKFYIGEDFSAVDLKFTAGEYAMTFVRSEAGSINDFVLGFDNGELVDWFNDLYANKMILGQIQTTLPKFEIKAHKNMTDILRDMGMTTTFSSADLSRMGTFTGNTFISRVLHDTYLKIDEKGAEGAAVTTVGVGVNSLPPEIRFDIPFLFILRHVETNTPIFIGKCGNPAE